MKSCTKIANVTEITHDEWLELRRTGIGGSDASTIAGLNPYSSLFTLYQDKIGALPAKEDNEAMRQGRDLEQYVADRWMERTGKKCQRNNYMWRSIEHPFMLADIDREVVGENAGVECKTTSVYNKADLEGGEIPLTYYVQCQHYMAVMGYERMYLAVLVLNKGFYDFVIERNDEEIESLIEQEQDFWNASILTREPPFVDGSDSTLLTLKTLSQESVAGSMAIFGSAEEKRLNRIGVLKKTIGELEEEKKELEAQLRFAMADNEVGEAGGWRVTYKSGISGRFDTKKFKEENPALYKKYYKEERTRRFSIRKLKEEE